MISQSVSQSPDQSVTQSGSKKVSQSLTQHLGGLRFYDMANIFTVVFGR